MITFYNMEGCPHCERAKILLEEEIKNNKVTVIQHLDAPKGVSSFPYFTAGDKVFVGSPSNKTVLFQKLGLYQVMETYCNKCSTKNFSAKMMIGVL
uniref:Glutaredoxin domain-containing protein n=1 Tax=viral metagenome TaxID=1070528 RepID=A0A6C0LY30_9ZZZZ